MNCKCQKCEKSTESKNEAIKNFPIMYQFYNGDPYNLFLSIRKGFYPYEYMDSWENFDETTVPLKEAFYSELNEQGITDKEYALIQTVWEVFEIKNLGEYHDLYAQCDTLLLADVFENFRDKCIEIYELDPAGIAWQACLKKAEVKLELLTDIDMLLMVENGIGGGICQATHRYAKANIIYSVFRCK